MPRLSEVPQRTVCRITNADRSWAIGNIVLTLESTPVVRPKWDGRPILAIYLTGFTPGTVCMYDCEVEIIEGGITFEGIDT